MKGIKQIADATCLGCGCLCDDITLSVADDRIVQAERACLIGERWFLADRPTNVPACRIDGMPATLEGGYARAAQILTDARHPLVLGLAGLTCEAQRVAVGLADRLGGCVDAGSGEAAALDSAMQAVGMVTATLGEVRHRADLVIFWGVDPATMHPRHFERYSLEPRGEFVPNGRADRTCVVIDSCRTPTADAADVFLQIKPGTDSAAVAILQALVGGSDQFDAAEVEQQTGVALVQWRDLADRMQMAHYGALFFDAASATESLLTLVRDMNRQTRFVCLPLGAAGNAAGAKQVLAWQTGYAGPVDFVDGYPRQRDGALSAGAALVFACDPVTDPIGALPVAVREHLSSIPRVVLHTADVTPPTDAAVAFTVATPGIHTGGTVFRCDGVPLPLRGAIASPYSTAGAVLKAIEQAVLKLRAIGTGH